MHAATRAEAARWIMRWAPRQRASVRIFCFPYAGAGASVYREWPRLVADDIDVLAVQPPGRENRLAEAPCTSLSALVEALLHALKPWLDRPFAFFGHSMGALVAYELARALGACGQSEPLHLFLSAYPAPERSERGTPLHRMSDEALLLRLRELNGIPSEIAAHDELMRLLLPTLRADCKAAETYRWSDGHTLTCPITACGGRQDPYVTLQDLKPWRRHSMGRYALRGFRGDHFYLNSERGALLGLVDQQLRESLPPISPMRARHAATAFDRRLP